VPFWRSGINKWDDFLQLNDVAVLLFASEFKLHLPGGPYPFPAPGIFAFAAASAEIVRCSSLSASRLGLPPSACC
jgi:putative oxidoreductase